MAIATAIFGLLASGAIMATSAWLGKQALDRTNKNLDRIENALTLHVLQNGSLPCPYLGTPAGTYAGGGCTGGTHHIGIVPYRDLGLQRTDVVDGWNRYLTYAVDDTWVDDQTTSNTPFWQGTALRTLEQLRDRNAPATTGADAAIEVTDGNGDGCLNATAPATPSGPQTCAAYVVLTHGEEGNGAFIDFAGAQRPNAAGTAVAENENNDGDAVFAGEARAGDASFDHILRYRTPAQILRDAL